MPPAEAPAPGCCTFYLPKKSRYCRFDVVPGHVFCGHHLTSNDDKSERIPCPLDGSHTIYKRDLKKHLRICPRAKEAAIEAALPCYRCDCNYGNIPGAAVSPAMPQPQPAAQLLSAAPADSVLELISNIRSAHAAHALQPTSPPPPAESADSQPPCSIAAYVPTPDAARRGKKAEKHGTQHQALVRVLQELKTGGAAKSILDCTAAFVELGCGKGGLSGAISERAPAASFVLVDWNKPAASVDLGLRERGVPCARYKIDLRHLWLRGVPELWPATSNGLVPSSETASSEGDACTTESSAAKASSGGAECIPCAADGNVASGGRKLVAIAKHLCGCATDFALRCLVSASDPAASAGEEKEQRGDSNATSSPPAISAVMIATCCHHRCTWDTYVNRSFMERLGFGSREFALIALLSSWATNASESGSDGGDRTASDEAPEGKRARREGKCVANADDVEYGGSGGLPASRESAHDMAAAPEEHSMAAGEALALTQSLGGCLDAATRSEIGRMCKTLLDTGRLRYIEQYGYKGKLQRYISSAVTPENVVLVAAPSRSGLVS